MNTTVCWSSFKVIILIPHSERDDFLSLLDQALQIAGLRSNHNPIAISGPTKEMQQPEGEMKEVLELAMATIPRLYLAQVWVPCNKLCVNISTNKRCMEMKSFIDSQSKMFNSWGDIDDYMHDYLQACQFHKLQIDLHNCHSNLCDFTISENPLAHYAQKARMSHCITVSHQSNTDDLYVVQFFLRPKYKQDACGDHSLHLLLRILETNLKSVTLLCGKQLVEEYLRRDAIECESIDSFSLMKSYKQNFSVLNMTTYLKMVDSCCLKPSSAGMDKGWVFLFPAKQSMCKNHVKGNSLLIKEKMEDLMKKIAVKSWKHDKWIVQFWAPKMVKNRCYLETSDQPYVVGYLAKGIALFRKQCTMYPYFVDNQARQNELGPPGRVFRFGHPEISPDLFNYTGEEFPMRNFAMLCCNRGYMAFPIFDNEGVGNHKVVGVLEFLGFYHSDLRIIGKLLEETKLCSTHMDFHPSFLANKSANIFSGREKALTEIQTTLSIINKIHPQFHMANVWVPPGDCLSSTINNMSCMELALSTKYNLKFMPTDSVHWIHVQARKGIIGMVLASENKSCFCPNLSEFSIVDQPLSHYDMSDRRDVCFAICLQSSHTGNLLYVMEFFLCPGFATYKYIGSFLTLLLPMMERYLRSFKMACGKEIKETFVVEVIEFSYANKLDSSELESACLYPVIFKSVQYNHTKEEQQKEYHHTVEEQHAEECSVVASSSNKRDKEKRKNSLNLSVEILQPYFGKKLKDVAEELGVGRSTIKRACRELGIRRWPNRKEHLFEEESAGNSEHSVPPAIGNLHPLDDVTETNADKVIVKVKYKKDLIKFEWSMSLGLVELSAEVAMRLNLGMDSFKLKYKDEDGDEILLTRDVDLQVCPKSRTIRGETLIRLLVR
ncbi:protein NLP7-like [Salvia hispanica]|uniref:protein NLP7-like n=1 Tax=Salvia hispanica TaxID=49212 RepID=UPI0020090546|nr:protein NLP7-like [Salvia hispanica]